MSTIHYNGIQSSYVYYEGHLWHVRTSYEFTYNYHSSLQHLVSALFSVSDATSPTIEALIRGMNTEQLLPFIWSTSFEAGNLLRDMNLLTGMYVVKE